MFKKIIFVSFCLVIFILLAIFLLFKSESDQQILTKGLQKSAKITAYVPDEPSSYETIVLDGDKNLEILGTENGNFSINGTGSYNPRSQGVFIKTADSSEKSNMVIKNGGSLSSAINIKIGNYTKLGLVDIIETKCVFRVEGVENTVERGITLENSDLTITSNINDNFLDVECETGSGALLIANKSSIAICGKTKSIFSGRGRGGISNSSSSANDSSTQTIKICDDAMVAANDTYSAYSLSATNIEIGGNAYVNARSSGNSTIVSDVHVKENGSIVFCDDCFVVLEREIKNLPNNSKIKVIGGSVLFSGGFNGETTMVNDQNVALKPLYIPRELDSEDLASKRIQIPISNNSLYTLSTFDAKIREFEHMATKIFFYDNILAAVAWVPEGDYTGIKITGGSKKFTAEAKVANNIELSWENIGHDNYLKNLVPSDFEDVDPVDPDIPNSGGETSDNGSGDGKVEISPGGGSNGAGGSFDSNGNNVVVTNVLKDDPAYVQAFKKTTESSANKIISINTYSVILVDKDGNLVDKTKVDPSDFYFEIPLGKDFEDEEIKTFVETYNTSDYDLFGTIVRKSPEYILRSRCVDVDAKYSVVKTLKQKAQ